jgi:hypothetical protein
MRTSVVGFIRSNYFLSSLLAASVLLVASVTFAAISFVSYSPANSNDVTVTQVTINTPASITAGNLLLANISINGGNQATTTAPSGWTRILRTDNDTNDSVISYSKIASASEPSNYTWSIDHQTTAKGEISQYSGIDTSNPIDSFSGNAGFGMVATTTPVTTSSSNEQIVTLFGVDVGKSANAGAYFTQPTGMTERYDLSNTPFGPSNASDDVVQATAGSSGSNSSTISGSKARNWVAQQIALRRAPTDCVGGTITHVGGNTIHTFTTVGTATLDCTSAGAKTANLLVVAGGGGGGTDGGGGGGAGGMITNGAYSLGAATYSVTVGDGGNGVVWLVSVGQNGQNSVFNDQTAVGGGYGSGDGLGDVDGARGGSGGGSVGGGNGGAGTAGQGNAGGTANTTGTHFPGGGGGGAGAVGVSPATGSSNGGNGGDGLSYSISGSAVTYAGGGGAGASADGGGNSPGAGGAGGGGSGGTQPTGAGADGASNTGGGGGAGSGGGVPLSGGKGGSGIVIVSYPTL